MRKLFLCLLCVLAAAGFIVSACGTDKDEASPTLTDYFIKGKIEAQDRSDDVSNVKLTLASASSSSTYTTESGGTYSFAKLAEGDYVVTPTKLGFIFTPEARSVAVAGNSHIEQNFTAVSIPGPYGISGTISGATTDATVVLGGWKSATASTDASGNYSFTELWSETYTVTPGKTYYTFVPASQTVTIAASSITDIDFTVYHTSGTSTLTTTGTSAVQGFIFSSASAVTETWPTLSLSDFANVQAASGISGEVRTPAAAGIIRIGTDTLTSITTAPASGYSSSITVESNIAAVIKTQDGKYAKIKITATGYSPTQNALTFDWYWQYDGSRNFSQ